MCGHGTVTKTFIRTKGEGTRVPIAECGLANLGTRLPRTKNKQYAPSFKLFPFLKKYDEKAILLSAQKQRNKISRPGLGCFPAFL